MSGGLDIGDPVRVLLPGERRRLTKRGKVLGFQTRQVWDAAKYRSHRSRWVIVTFPDGSVVTVPPTAVTSDLARETRNEHG